MLEFLEGASHLRCDIKFVAPVRGAGVLGQFRVLHPADGGGQASSRRQRLRHFATRGCSSQRSGIPRRSFALLEGSGARC